MARHPFAFQRKEVTSSIHGLNQQLEELPQSRTIGLWQQSTLCNVNNPSWFANTLVLAQQFGPLPRAYETQPQALMDQVKEVCRKFERAQRIADPEVDPIIYLSGFGLSTSVR